MRCTYCEGSGIIPGVNEYEVGTCPTCNGTGQSDLCIHLEITDECIRCNKYAKNEKGLKELEEQYKTRMAEIAREEYNNGLKTAIRLVEEVGGETAEVLIAGLESSMYDLEE